MSLDHRGVRHSAPSGMPTIVTRERVDIGEDPYTGASYLHKLWSDGTEEWARLTFSKSDAGGVIREELTREAYEQAIAGHEPQPVIENSDWGYGRAIRE